MVSLNQLSPPGTREYFQIQIILNHDSWHHEYLDFLVYQLPLILTMLVTKAYHASMASNSKGLLTHETLGGWDRFSGLTWAHLCI